MENNSKYTANNPKNAIYQAYKEKVKTAAETKAKDYYQDKSFGDEWQSVYNVSNILKLVFSFASLCTVFVALFLTLRPLLGTLISGAISFLICSILEVLKVWTWSKLSKQILKYKTYPLVLVGACVLFNLSSVGGSIIGAYQLPQTMAAAENTKVSIIDTDSINKSYLLQIAKIDNIIIEQSKNANKTTSNYTKGKINKTLLSLADQKSILIEQQNKSIASAENKNTTTLIEHKATAKKKAKTHTAEIEKTQIMFVAVAISFEVFLILCSLFISYYLFRVDIDITENDQPQTATVQPTINANLEPTHKATPHEAPTAKRIGYFKTKDEKRPNIQAMTQTAQNEQILDKLEYTRICRLKECSKPYLHGHNAQKYCSPKCRKKANR